MCAGILGALGALGTLFSSVSGAGSKSESYTPPETKFQIDNGSQMNQAAQQNLGGEDANSRNANKAGANSLIIAPQRQTGMQAATGGASGVQVKG
jgi:hypothetical protein